MKKDYKSIACPECKNQSVKVKVTYPNKSQRDIIYSGEEAIEFYQERVMNCHCPNCNKDYKVTQGEDTYIVLREPLPMTVSRDVQLLAIYNSSFDHDFKIVRMAPYSDQPITIAIAENDEYPVIIPEKQNIQELTKVKKILFNTWMSRYR